MKLIIPEGYKPCLNVYDTQNCIGKIHTIFEKNLSAALNLHRVSAPLFVEASTGLNDDLNGFERIWVVFAFHLNRGWKPKTSPPVVGGKRRIGVFATRAPYRPNPIGISCVELEKIEGLRVHIRNFDMLDGTPVLDIKPYIPEADSFPCAKAGWRDAVSKQQYELVFSEDALKKMDFIRSVSGLDMENFCRIQLVREPASDERKRIEPYVDGLRTIGCRTWRIVFSVEGACVAVRDILSNYTESELCDGTDRYGDKVFHRRFREKFS